MRWRRAAPVQEIGALIATGPGAVDRVTVALAAKSALFRDLRVDHGADWMAIFAAPMPGDPAEGESILPSLPDTIALYEDAPGWWLPVGVELAVPAHVRAMLRDALAEANALAPPAIVVPRFPDACAGATADHADLYALGEAQPFGPFRLARLGLAVS